MIPDISEGHLLPNNSVFWKMLWSIWHLSAGIFKAVYVKVEVQRTSRNATSCNFCLRKETLTYKANGFYQAT